MEVDSNRWPAAIHSKLRPRILGRATHIFGPGSGFAGDVPSLWHGHRTLLSPAGTHERREGAGRAARYFRRSSYLLRPVEYWRHDGLPGQRSPGSECVIWFIWECAGEGAWRKNRSHGARGGPDDLRLCASAGDRNLPRGQSAKPSLDQNGHHRNGLPGYRWLGDRIRALLLARAQYGCD